MMVRAYGARIPDCISAAFGDIRQRPDRLPSNTGYSSEQAQPHTRAE